MRNVYAILEAIEKHFRNEEANINAVHFGNFNEADLSKTTLFPLAQFNIGSIEYTGTTIDFTINLLVLDLVDESKDYDNSFIGALSEHQFVLKNDPIAEYLYEELDNKLAGWGMDLQISTPNDISIC